jgi:hypothetical protein
MEGGFRTEIASEFGELLASGIISKIGQDKPLKKNTKNSAP